MNYENIIILANNGDSQEPFMVYPEGQEQQQQTSSQTTVPQDSSSNQQQQQSQQAGPFSSVLILVVWAVVIGGTFYFTSRSQRKKEKAIKDMQDNIKVGDDVYTSGGFYGKVIERMEDKYIVEFGTNRGVRIPVRKSDIYPIKAATEEE